VKVFPCKGSNRVKEKEERVARHKMFIRKKTIERRAKKKSDQTRTERESSKTGNSWTGGVTTGQLKH